MKRSNNKIEYHFANGVSIDRNGYAVLILNEVWANDVSAAQTSPNVHNGCIGFYGSSMVQIYTVNGTLDNKHFAYNLNS